MVENDVLNMFRDANISLDSDVQKLASVIATSSTDTATAANVAIDSLNKVTSRRNGLGKPYTGDVNDEMSLSEKFLRL